MLAIGKFKPYPSNPKDHPPEQIDALASFIKRIGFKFPIAIDEDDSIIAGHGRHIAAQQLGMTHVPCLRHIGLTEPEKRALRVADNRLAELAATNEKNLTAELNALAGEFDLSSVGFSETDLKRLLVVPEFKPATINEQSVLDRRTPMVCPHCGKTFAR